MTKQVINNKSTLNPISERKRQENKLNAQKSTGPRTFVGKGNSRFNALKHGLLAKYAIVTKYEDKQEFNIQDSELFTWRPFYQLVRFFTSLFFLTFFMVVRAGCNYRIGVELTALDGKGGSK